MKNKKFAICYNKTIKNASIVKDALSQILSMSDVSFEEIDIDNLREGFDFVFVIGGDGTILKSARFYAKFSTPIFGINLGRLGFLSQSSKEEIEDSVKKILREEFVVEDRMMLECKGFTALNDFVVKGASSARTSRFSLKINGKIVCDYLADGIIIATPTGSTAYGLSAGGPVLAPNLNAFVIVPICPHTLTARPLVVPFDEEITICGGENCSGYRLSADGQEFSEFNSEIIIKKAKNDVKLALLQGGDFYAVLRDKLHWGTSPANI